MKHRGLYNQAEGNEFRRASEAAAEHYADNEVVERGEANTLKAMLKQRQWDAMTNHVDALRKQGWSQTRIDAVVSRASFGMRF
tara:strand:+ start:2026 stop:2274 length:249 start_codon:yes stop_codon:yes gene_type:complete